MQVKITRRKRKKVRYKSLSLKLSTLSYAKLKRYCQKHRLTPNKVLKKALKVYMERFGPVVSNNHVPVGENQLTIFDAGADYPVISGDTAGKK